MRANPLVPWGGSVQRSGGETSEPSQVYLGGISPPGPNAGLRSLKALTDTPDPAAFIYLARNPFRDGRPQVRETLTLWCSALVPGRWHR